MLLKEFFMVTYFLFVLGRARFVLVLAVIFVLVEISLMPASFGSEGS